MELFADTNVGKVRKNNEDAYYVGIISEGLALLVVADGVGGHAFGEIASQTTVGIFKSLLQEGKLAAATDPTIREILLTMSAQKAHVEVSRMAVEDPEKNGMSCTLTVAIADKDTITVLQIGDTRLYKLSCGELSQLTVDQTVANDLLLSKRITPEQFSTHPDRGTLSQSIGLEAIGQPMEPAVETHHWHAGDIILVCSDGLTDMIDDDTIRDSMSDEPISVMCQNLINAALENGGKDNVTVALAKN